jgi:hypothetical protein
MQRNQRTKREDMGDNVTDLQILERHAIEYCEILNAYNPSNDYRFTNEGKRLFILKDGYTFGMLRVMENEGVKSIFIMCRKSFFIDYSPFEQKKEVSCED